MSQNELQTLICNRTQMPIYTRTSKYLLHNTKFNHDHITVEQHQLNHARFDQRQQAARQQLTKPEEHLTRAHNNTNTASDTMCIGTVNTVEISRPIDGLSR